MTATNHKNSSLPHRYLNILRELGCRLSPETEILDLGCGSGHTVSELRALGYRAFGCDLRFKQHDETDTAALQRENILRRIDTSPYRLPFADNHFDIIISDQVFEHVRNYEETICETGRILKSNGCCLHVFPARLKPIESHTRVPFGSIIRCYPWLLFWATMGIHNRFQHGFSAKKKAALNYEYLTSSTCYLPGNKIIAAFEKYFSEVFYAEKLFLKHSEGGRFACHLSGVMPFIPRLYRTFRARVLVARNPFKTV